MELVGINKKDIIFALDIGTRSIIGTVGIIKDRRFHVLCENYLEHEERAMIDGQIHDINLVANAVNKVKKNIEKELKINLEDVAIAAAGRFLKTVQVKEEITVNEDKEIDKEIIRGLELTVVKKAEEEINKSTKGKLYCVGYSVKNYYLNGYVISNLLSHKGENIAAEVIATFLPRSVVDSLYAVMDKCNLNVINLTLEPIAAMEAVIPQSLRLLNLALVDIGAGTSDIAISSKEAISAYGMVPVAGDEVTEAIAQAYLVDFNTAERMKREISTKVTIDYCDVLGLENSVQTEDMLKVVEPVIEKICSEISDAIINLNGGKSPNAVFLVGGGAHTPGLKERLAEKLNLPQQRVGIKDRNAVTDCICLDNDLGSIGVTVLGIALVSIKKSGHDFIDVSLNNSVVSLFSSHKHNVMDVIMQAGINPKLMLAKNGKNIRFDLNSIRRVAFGTLGINASIKINGKEAKIDSEVKEGDSIEIDFARDGKDAEPRVKEFVQSLNCKSFYVDGEIVNMEPICIVNNEIKDMDFIIQENDIVEVIYPDSLEHFKKYFEKQDRACKYFLGDVEIKEEHLIKEGEEITRVYETISNEDSEKKQLKEEEAKLEDSEIQSIDSKEITIRVNDEIITLQGKMEYIFVEIFNYIDFDLSSPKGNLVLTVNGEKAGYYDKLKDGDIVVIGWETF